MGTKASSAFDRRVGDVCLARSVGRGTAWVGLPSIERILKAASYRWLPPRLRQKKSFRHKPNASLARRTDWQLQATSHNSTSHYSDQLWTGLLQTISSSRGLPPRIRLPSRHFI